ncbi:MAG: TRAP transporter small permease [Clostridiales Family XIII bacterium]|jgi:TRAP-type C4-dicarboxylate transport system permease small subunit|nr:TRAP transporter small permease [Clostridiales Family XIII bacterium]
MRKKTNKFVTVMNNAEEYLLVALISVTVVLLFMQVVMRYVFNNSLAWTEELSRYLFIWESWLGISIGAKHAKHIKIVILTDRAKGLLRPIILTVADLFTLFVLVALVYYGFILTQKIMDMHTSSSVLHIPMWMIYASLPAGCAFMTLRIVTDLVNRLRGRGERQEGGETS